MTVELKLGTRKSKLALIQANLVKDLIESQHENVTVSIVGMSTAGDRDVNTSLYTLGGSDKGLWTKELESALLDNSVDMIVHSLKDVQSQLPDGCILGAFPVRADPTDALVVKEGLPFRTLDDLPDGSIVGTSSIRRVAQLRKSYPKLKFMDVRGNLDTRLAKLDDPNGQYIALILASAGLKRFSHEHSKRITCTLKSPTLLHAVGQGSLGIEIRENDEKILNYLKPINCIKTQLAVTVERALLRTLEGGCSAPVGVETNVKEISDNNTYNIHFKANLTTLDGSQQIEECQEKSIQNILNADQFGVEIANIIISKGGGQILKDIHNNKSNQIINKTNIVSN